MRITPLDVRKQEFRKTMRGLDAEEVYAFLSTVADEYEAVLNDNKALRERLLELDDKVQEYRSLEKTLRNTLLTAERVTVESKDNARREATIIVKEAQLEAERALRDIKTEAAKLRQQVQQLRAQRDAYLAKMRVITQSHLSFVDSTQNDFQVEDRALDGLDIDEPAMPAPRPSHIEPDAHKENSLFEPGVDASAAGGTEAMADEFPALPSPDVNTPPQAEADLGRGPNHASATMESLPERAPVPGAPGTETHARPTAQGSVSEITAIIDRVSRTQQGTQQSPANPAAGPQGYAPSPPAIEATTTLGAGPPPARDSRVDSPPRTATATADALANPPAGAIPRGHDITGEWNIDQIRRDILGRGPTDPDEQ